MTIDAQLSLIILAVRDLARSLEFYSHCFGWPLLVDVPVYKEFRMSSGQRLGLYHHEGFGRNTGQQASMAPPEMTSATELYFHSDDPQSLMSRLLDSGAKLLSPMSRRPWNDDAAYLADPDGNVIVVASSGSVHAPNRKCAASSSAAR